MCCVAVIPHPLYFLYQGQMIDPKKGCADCTENTFQPTPNDSQFCKACTLCNNSKSYSVFMFQLYLLSYYIVCLSICIIRKPIYSINGIIRQGQDTHCPINLFYLEHWSVEVKKCTRIMDTTCECQDGFVPTNDKSSACKCEKGSGVNHVKGKC